MKSTHVRTTRYYNLLLTSLLPHKDHKRVEASKKKFAIDVYDFRVIETKNACK